MSVLSIQGSVLVTVGDDTTDFAPYLGLAKRLGLSLHAVVPIELTGDATHDVQLNGMNVGVIIFVATGHVAMTVSSDDGDDQTVGGRFGILISDDSTYTDIAFTRVAGEATSVKLLLGQMA